MNDNRKRKREDEQEVYYQQQPNSQNVQIVSSPNGSIDVNQPLFINQLPVIQNQQLVYQLPHVQGVNPGNNAPENTYYVFIPVAETAEGQTVAKEETELKTGQYVTYRTLGNEAKPGNSVITIDGVKQSNITTQQPKVEHIQPIQAKPHEVYVVDNNKHYQTPQQLQHHQNQGPPSCQVQQTHATSSVNSQTNNKWKHQLYRCDYSGCNEKFSSLHDKKLHQENHLFPEGETFKCGLCNMVFKKAYERNKHIETHTVVNTHKCKHCMKSFPYYTTLVSHVEEAFAVEPFRCAFCDRKFDDTVTFLRHNGWCMKTCKCGLKICGDVVFQKHVNQCSEYGAKGK